MSRNKQDAVETLTPYEERKEAHRKRKTIDKLRALDLKQKRKDKRSQCY